MLNFCDFIQVYVFTTNHHLELFSFVELLVLIIKKISAFKNINIIFHVSVR